MCRAPQPVCKLCGCFIHLFQSSPSSAPRTSRRTLPLEDPPRWLKVLTIPPKEGEKKRTVSLWGAFTIFAVLTPSRHSRPGRRRSRLGSVFIRLFFFIFYFISAYTHLARMEMVVGSTQKRVHHRSFFNTTRRSLLWVASARMFTLAYGCGGAELAIGEVHRHANVFWGDTGLCV